MAAIRVGSIKTPTGEIVLLVEKPDPGTACQQLGVFSATLDNDTSQDVLDLRLFAEVLEDSVHLFPDHALIAELPAGTQVVRDFLVFNPTERDEYTVRLRSNWTSHLGVIKGEWDDVPVP